MIRKSRKFKVGDRVKINDLIYVGKRQIKNSTGIVRHIYADDGDVGVELDDEIEGHNLNGIIDSDRGWYVPALYLVFLSKQLEFSF